jgi:ankyrin repeat protein
LYYASSRNHPNIIELLIDAGADVNGTMEHNGDTPAIVASENDSTEALECLIKNGANINQTNDNGENAIFCASRYNTKETLAIVKMLHKNGCSINQTNVDGFNPVMWASKHGNYKILGYLLQHENCDFETKNNDDKNAFDLATEGNHVRCLNLLNLYKNEKSGGNEGNNRRRRRR